MPGKKVTAAPVMGHVEIHRAVLRAGGLWTRGELVAVCGEGARNWYLKQGFPPHVSAGDRKLFCGWEVWRWLEDTERYARAAEMYDAIVRLSARG